MGAKDRKRGIDFERDVCHATAEALGLPYSEFRRSWAGEEALCKGDAVRSERAKKLFPFVPFCRRYSKKTTFKIETIFEVGFFHTALGRWFLDAQVKLDEEHQHNTSAKSLSLGSKPPIPIYIFAYQGSRVWFGLTHSEALVRYLQTLDVPCLPEPYMIEYDVVSYADSICMFSYRHFLEMIKRKRK